MKLALILLFCFVFQVASKEFEGQLFSIEEEIFDVQGNKVSIVIHYTEKQRFLAKRVQDMAKTLFPKVHEYFEYIPRSAVHFVFEKSSLDSNGSAQVFPYNIIHLQDYPPTGDSSLIASHDWFKTLVLHEYVHIVTLEMTHGWMNGLRKIFGSTVKFAAINPRWFLEGIATWAESRFTGEGRLFHPIIIQSVVNLLKNPSFCDDLGCWDTPAMFPHGKCSILDWGAFSSICGKQKNRDPEVLGEGKFFKHPFFRE